MFLRAVKPLILVMLLSAALFLAIDFVFGERLVQLIKVASRQDSFRIEHDFYHHTLASNFKGVGFWGNDSYPVCTNAYGMKASCEDAKTEEKIFDIGFIGDSFTEGIGLPFEQTFVGMLSKNHPNLKIANLAVASYSPSIYLAKIKHLTDEGFVFRKIIVFVDISDIQDESVYRSADGSIFIGTPPVKTRYSAVKRKIGQNFPLAAFAKRTLVKTKTDFGRYQAVGFEEASEATPSYDNIIANQSIYSHGYERSAWTYKPNTSGYGKLGVEGSISKALDSMGQLHKLLTERDVRLSVAVYPWPGTLKHDQLDSKQVKIWEDFCKDKCDRFYNFFTLFFAEVTRTTIDAVISKYFFKDDVHLNAEGNSLIATQLLNEGL